MPVDAKTFVPIAGPPDHYSGPTTGLSTEKGDSWLTAVAKINAGFAHVYSMMRTPTPPLGEPAVAVDGGANPVTADELHAVKEELAQVKAKLQHYADLIEALLNIRHEPALANQQPNVIAAQSASAALLGKT